MDTHALILALHALQMEIRAMTAAFDECKFMATDAQAEADRLMEEAEKAARTPEVVIGEFPAFSGIPIDNSDDAKGPTGCTPGAG